MFDVCVCIGCMCGYEAPLSVLDHTCGYVCGFLCLCLVCVEFALWGLVMWPCVCVYSPQDVIGYVCCVGLCVSLSMSPIPESPEEAVGGSMPVCLCVCGVCFFLCTCVSVQLRSKQLQRGPFKGDSWGG